MKEKNNLLKIAGIICLVFISIFVNISCVGAPEIYPYPDSLTPNEQCFLVMDTSIFLTKFADKDFIKKQYETDSDFKSFVNWALSYKPATAIETIKAFNTFGINIDERISDILLSVKPNISLKKEIIALKIFNQSESEIAYTFEGALKFLRPKYISDFKSLSEPLKSAYSLSYATLAFIADSFEVDFFKTFKKAREKFEGCEKINVKALSAVITYKVSPKIFPQKKYLCKLFEVSVGEYNKYLKQME